MKAITLNADWKCLGKSVKISSSFTMATICKNIYLNHHLLECVSTSSLLTSAQPRLEATLVNCQGLPKVVVKAFHF